MATAQKTTEHSVGHALGNLLRSLNPFKKASSEHKQAPAKKEEAKAMDHERAHHRPAKHKKQGESRKSASAHHGHRSHAKSKSRRSHHAKPAAPEPRSEENQAVMTALHPEDPAHAPGHRKLDVTKEFQEPTGEKVHIQKSALDDNADGDIAARVNSPVRRINSPSRTASKRGTRLPK